MLQLNDLRAPAVTLASEMGPADGLQVDQISGLLAQALGETQEEQKARIEAATKNANDLTGLVRKKKPKTDTNGAASSEPASNGKRRLEDVVEEGSEKKAKLDD